MRTLGVVAGCHALVAAHSRPLRRPARESWPPYSTSRCTGLTLHLPVCAGNSLSFSVGSPDQLIKVDPCLVSRLYVAETAAGAAAVAAVAGGPDSDGASVASTAITERTFFEGRFPPTNSLSIQWTQDQGLAAAAAAATAAAAAGVPAKAAERV